MNDRIAQALTKLFEKHRIIFWYDAKHELRDDYQRLMLPGVEKVELTNNEYTVKYRLLRQEPEKKFLLYVCAILPSSCSSPVSPWAPTVWSS